MLMRKNVNNDVSKDLPIDAAELTLNKTKRQKLVKADFGYTNILKCTFNTLLITNFRIIDYQCNHRVNTRNSHISRKRNKNNFVSKTAGNGRYSARKRYLKFLKYCGRVHIDILECRSNIGLSV